MIPRPVGVTIVGVLIVISGIFAILGGILAFFNRTSLSEEAEALGLAMSPFSLILTIIVGIIYLLVAKGLFNGNNFSRLVVGIITGISLLVGLFHLLFVSGLRWAGLIQMIFALVILGLLYSRRASEFFASR
jgi:hypothetical protein